ncbi:MAG: mediator complex subunit [Phylliscum demangeonii]|nr:MAG: mediator complex subunit [Phylliscum demangeonii]
MPLLMDDELDIDELFGEPTLALTPVLPPPPKGLAQRLDDLRTIGCCQKLAWSRHGCLATITRDGLGVSVCVLACDPGDGRWHLSPGDLIPQVARCHNGVPLHHLSWDPTGWLLALADARGRLSIFRASSVVNQLALTRASLSDHEDDLGAVVGLTWLTPERELHCYQMAQKTGDSFHWSLSRYKTLGPYPPPNRAALVYITRLGTLMLLYQQPDRRWAEVRKSMELPNSSDDVLSHASFCPDRDHTLLLLTRTMARKYRLYRIQIRWTAADAHPSAPAPGAATPLNPTMPVRAVKLALADLEEVDVSARMTTDEEASGSPQLSHLELLPLPPPTRNSEPVRPTILLVLSQCPGPQSPGYQETYSVLVRWELRDVTQKLHPELEKLASQTKSTASLQWSSVDLVRLEDVVVDRVVVSLQTVSQGTMLGIGYSDGLMEFRGRGDFHVVAFDGDVDRVSSLPQSGFAFPQEGPCLSVAFSPNACMAATQREESNRAPALRTLRYCLGEIGTSFADDKFSQAAVALATQYATACIQTESSDDVLGVIQQLSNAALEAAILREVYRALKPATDLSPHPTHENLFRNELVLRCLSLQDWFGHRGGRRHADVAARVARVTLQLRTASAVFGIAVASAMKRPGGGGGDAARPPPEPEMTKPETLQALLGQMRWSVELMNFLVDDVMALAQNLIGPVLDANLITDTLTLHSSCALPLLLNGTSRCFLRSLTRALGVFSNLAHRKLQSLPSPASLSSAVPSGGAASAGARQRQQYQQQQHDLLTTVLALLNHSAPVSLSVFDHLLLQLGDGVQRAYNAQPSTAMPVPVPAAAAPSANPAPDPATAAAATARSQTEREMLTGVRLVPPVLMPAVRELLTGLVPALRDQIDPAELYLRDFAWLGVAEDDADEAGTSPFGFVDDYYCCGGGGRDRYHCDYRYRSRSSLDGKWSRQRP